MLLALAAAAAIAFETVARYAGGQSFLGPDGVQWIETYFGLGFAALALPALPAALRAPFVRRGDPPLRSRSALALVPGALCAIAIGLAAFAYLALASGLSVEAGATIAVQRLKNGFASYLFLFVPLALVLGAMIGGARTPEATAAAAGPAVLVALFGMAAEASIGVQFAALAVPFVLAAAGIGLLYAIAPARAVTPWLAGPVLALIAGLPLLTGFLTPTEWIAFLALAGIVVALPIQTLALALPFGTLLRQIATEMAAAIVVVGAAALVSTALAMAGATGAILDLVGTGTGVLVLGAAVFFLLCYLLSAALALFLALLPMMPVIVAARIDLALAGAILVLLALAAMAARSGRRGGAGLTPAAALASTAMLAGLAILLALIPAIATGPAAFMR
jgi:hypothetical protein